MRIHSTTIVCIRRGNVVAMAGDGQVTVDTRVLKTKAIKLRRLYHGKALAGFAGSASDALTLFQKFEDKLEEHRGKLQRAAVELAKEWRTDRVLRRLEALMIVADASQTFLLSGNGDLIEPDEGIVAIGSGGSYAQAAAQALLRHTELDAEAIAREALRIAAEICVFTNDTITIETLATGA